MGLLLFISALFAWPCFLWMGGQLSAEFQFESAVSDVISLGLILTSLGFLAAIRHRRDPGPNHSLVWVWFVVQPIALALSSWPQWAATAWDYIPSLFLQMLIIVGPTIALSFLLKSFHFWRGYSGLVLAILATSSVLVDGSTWISGSPYLLEMPRFDTASSLSSEGPWGIVIVLLASGVLTSWIIPKWFIWCTNAYLLNDETSARISGLWKEFHPRVPQVMLWPTACRMSNAVVLGSVSRRSLLITDRMLLTFTSREVDLVVLHELAHCLRKHSLIRLLPTLMAVPCLFWALSVLSGFLLGVAALNIALAFVFALVATCWWTEWDADRYAVHMAVQAFQLETSQANREYASVLTKLYETNRIRKTSWSHPSLQHRLAPLLGCDR